jgi:hypothetical protein
VRRRRLHAPAADNGSVLIIALAIITVLATGLLALAQLLFTSTKAANAFAESDRLVNALEIGISTAIEVVRSDPNAPPCAPAPTATPTPIPTPTPAATTTPTAGPTSTAPPRSYRPIDVRVTCIPPSGDSSEYRFSAWTVGDCRTPGSPHQLDPSPPLDLYNADGLAAVPTPSPTPDPSATPTPSAAPTSFATPDPDGTSTVLETTVMLGQGLEPVRTARSVIRRPCRSSTATPTAAPTSTPDPTPTPTPEPTPEPTAAPTPEPTPEPTLTPPPTPEPTPAPTPFPSPAPTETPTPTPAPTESPTPAPTPTGP